MCACVCMRACVCVCVCVHNQMHACIYSYMVFEVTFSEFGHRLPPCILQNSRIQCNFCFLKFGGLGFKVTPMVFKVVAIG